MTRKIIRFCYRKIITAGAQQLWDKYVFDSTYAEFRLQAQFYNQEKKYTRFSELLLHVPGAEKLHFLTSAGVINYLSQLADKIPDIVNNLGTNCFVYKHYTFEIIESGTRNRRAHQVAISFFRAYDLARHYREL